MWQIMGYFFLTSNNEFNWKLCHSLCPNTWGKKWIQSEFWNQSNTNPRHYTIHRKSIKLQRSASVSEHASFWLNLTANSFPVGDLEWKRTLAEAPMGFYGIFLNHGSQLALEHVWAIKAWNLCPLIRPHHQTHNTTYTHHQPEGGLSRWCRVQCY